MPTGAARGPDTHGYSTTAENDPVPSHRPWPSARMHSSDIVVPLRRSDRCAPIAPRPEYKHSPIADPPHKWPAWRASARKPSGAIADLHRPSHRPAADSPLRRQRVATVVASSAAGRWPADRSILRIQSEALPPSVPATASANSARALEFASARAGAGGSALLAEARPRSSSTPMGWDPRNPAKTVLLLKLRSDRLPDLNMRSRTSNVLPAPYRAGSQALA